MSKTLTKKNKGFWRDFFMEFAKEMDFLDYTIGRRNPFPSNWLNLSANPIVKIESLYDGTLMWESDAD